MRVELIGWSIRGAGLALGAAAVVGVLLLANAAAQVLLLVFVSMTVMATAVGADPRA